MCVHERLFPSLCLIVSFFLRNFLRTRKFSGEYVRRSIPAATGGTTTLQGENGGTVVPFDKDRAQVRELDDSSKTTTLAYTGTSVPIETYEFKGDRDDQLKEACTLALMGDYLTSLSACKVAEFLPEILFNEFGRLEKSKLEQYRESESVQELLQKLEVYMLGASSKKNSLCDVMRTCEEMQPFFFRRHANSRRTRFEPTLLPEAFIYKVRENRDVMSELFHSTLAGDKGDMDVNDVELKKILCAKGTDIRDHMTRSANRLLNNAILAKVRFYLLICRKCYESLSKFPHKKCV